MAITDGNFDLKDLNSDPAVHGIMIQLPYPDSANLIKQIAPEKDIDGLQENSPYLPAVVVAVKKILQESGFTQGTITVVGSKGTVGAKLVKELGALGMDKDDFDPQLLKTSDVVISATGHPNLITPEMVKDGVIAIDVGYPKGDFDPKVGDKAIFFTPVPGGVGPVTVVCLFENLLASK